MPADPSPTKKRKNRNPKIIRLITVLFAVILLTFIFIARVNFVHSEQRVLIAACDALFAVGTIYIVWGIVLYAAFKGGLDGLFFLARNAANMLKKEGEAEFTTYYDFIKTRDRTPNSFKTFLKLGACMFAASIILLIIQRSIK